MFTHNKKLQYTVRVSQPNPALANLLLEQFGGPQGELAAAMRYFTQALGEDDAGRKDMLLDISTEELSHLEVIGSLVGMLNKGAKGRLAEAVEEEGELFRSLQGAGMLPIALGFSADASFRMPMAVAVIGGLITSTVLSLVVVPAAFTLVDDGEAWLVGKLRRRSDRRGLADAPG